MPAENALSLEWQDKPFDELLIEAQRVGAYDGNGEHLTDFMPDVCAPYRCRLRMKRDVAYIWITDSREKPQRVEFAYPNQPDPPIKEVVSACRYHAALNYPTPEAHYAAIVAEDSLKARFAEEYSAVATITENVLPDMRAATEALRRLVVRAAVPGSVNEAEIFDGLTRKVYRPGKEFHAVFDADRTLVVDIAKLSQAERGLLAAAMQKPAFKTKVKLNG